MGDADWENFLMDLIILDNFALSTPENKEKSKIKENLAKNFQITQLFAGKLEKAAVFL